MEEQIITFDPLYGNLSFNTEISDLISRPLVQRMRRVRLSNVDSLSYPGISGISRYEHLLGTCYLSTQLGCLSSVDRAERLTVQAAALLHDTAAPGLSHLVEEAYQYLGVEYDHEAKWGQLMRGRTETGGIDRQVYLGRESGLRIWAERCFGSDADEAIHNIVNYIRGSGRWGPVISGSVDLDNIDNVARVFYHLGIGDQTVDGRYISREIRGVNPCRTLSVSEKGAALVEQWIESRERVYTRLMEARTDFAGKCMLVFSSMRAIQDGIIDTRDWVMTDDEIMTVILSEGPEDAKHALERWLLADPWEVGLLAWMDGPMPDYTTLAEFSKMLTAELGRVCIAYRIKDKRKRNVVLEVNGEHRQLGEKPSQWLLGVASPIRRSFNEREQRSINNILGQALSGAKIVRELGSARATFEDTRGLF